MLNLIKLLLVMAVTLGLSGCGSGSSSAKLSPTILNSTAKVTVKGVAMDGPIEGGLIGVDQNSNGYLEGSEVLTSTTTDGRFEFTYLSHQPGNVIVSGGFDSYLNLPFNGLLKAELPTTNTENLLISPITTLLTEGMTEDKIRDIFNIDDSVELSTISSYVPDKVMKAGIMLHTMALLLNSSTKIGLPKIYAKMANMPDFDRNSIENMLINLGSRRPSTVASLISDSISEIGSLKELNEVVSVQGFVVTTTFNAIRKFEDNSISEVDLLASKPKMPTLEIEMLPEFTNSIDMNFVKIKSGSFFMGLSDVEGYHDYEIQETPRHLVEISKDFYIGKHEVTAEQWFAVMGSFPPFYEYLGDDYPITSLKWSDVQEFISRLEAMEPGSKYRLPTEAEWEYAARAGTSTISYFGNNVASDGTFGKGDSDWLDLYVWYSQNSYDQDDPYYHPQLHPVGLKLPNSWGLFDVQGNASEWVQDSYDDDYTFRTSVSYPSEAVVDPVHISTNNTFHVIRGGSAMSEATHIRVSLRELSQSFFKFNGFRLVKAIE